jgi:hypothetical protein
MKTLRDLLAYKINGRPYYDVIAEWQNNAIEEFESAYRQLDYQRSADGDVHRPFGPQEVNLYRDAGDEE